MTQDRDDGESRSRRRRGGRSRRRLRRTRLRQRVSVREITSEGDAGTEQSEKVRRHSPSADLFRVAAVPRHLCAPGGHRGKVLEKICLIPEIAEIRRREWPVGDVPIAHLTPHDHEPVGVRVREWPQEHRVDDAEDRRADADA